MPRGENRPSLLLSRDENEQVFGLIGPKCQSLATAVVQLFTTEGPGHSEWKKKDTGVLCLIKDNSKRSYFFRIYCLYRKTMIWEHEVYTQIEYKSPRPYLHTFEAEEYMTAFNFANEDEAKVLRNILIEKIDLRKQRREERRQRSMLASASRYSSGSSQGYAANARQNGVAAPPPVPAPAAPPSPPSPVPAPVPKPAPNYSSGGGGGGGYTLKSSSKKPKARKLTKADIGMPQDFKHISHVGWDANKGFDVDNLPEEEMRSFFSKAGISETQLQDHETRQFIYEFINTHGGLDAVKEELHDNTKAARGVGRGVPSAGAPPPPPPPAAPAPPVPARSPAPHHPPAPPSRAPPPPPARVVPPPPPPPASLAPPRNPPPPRPAQRHAVVGAAVRAPAAAAGRAAAAATSGRAATAAAATAAARAARRAAAAASAALAGRRRGRPARRAHGEHTPREQVAQESGRGAEGRGAGGGGQQEQPAQRDPAGRRAQGGGPVAEQLRQRAARARGVRAGRRARPRAAGAQPRHTLLGLGAQRRDHQRRRVGRLKLHCTRHTTH